MAAAAGRCSALLTEPAGGRPGPSGSRTRREACGCAGRGGQGECRHGIPRVRRGLDSTLPLCGRMNELRVSPGDLKPNGPFSAVMSGWRVGEALRNTTSRSAWARARPPHRACVARDDNKEHRGLGPRTHLCEDRKGPRTDSLRARRSCLISPEACGHC